MSGDRRYGLTCACQKSDLIYLCKLQGIVPSPPCSRQLGKPRKRERKLLSHGLLRTIYVLRVLFELPPIGLNQFRPPNGTCFSVEVSFSSHDIQLGLSKRAWTTPFQPRKVFRLSR